MSAIPTPSPQSRLKAPVSGDALPLSFIKMHGLGNDFVMLRHDQLPENVSLEKLAAYVCDRHFGIGADGLIVAAPPSDPARFDIKFVYLNSDGSWAEMCGNGIRCFALFVRDQGLVNQDAFTAETLAGPIKPTINADRTVTVDMGPPILEAARIPFKAEGLPTDSRVLNHTLHALERTIPVTAVSMGNPHCLVFQQDLPEALDPAVFGPVMEKHPDFPAKTNVEFVEILNRNHVKVTVWERGCGFTLACGTGACATAVGAILLGKTDHEVTVDLPGGPLKIVWDGDPATHVMMSGPAAYAFEGEIAVPRAMLQA